MTNPIPCGMAIPQTFSTLPVDVDFIRRFLSRAEMLEYESAWVQEKESQRLCRSGAGHPADVCGGADVEAATRDVGAAHRAPQPGAVGEEPGDSGPTESGPAHGRRGHRRTCSGVDLWPVGRAARAPLRRGSPGDEGAVDRAARHRGRP